LTTIFEQLCELHRSISEKRREIDEVYMAVHPSGRRIIDEYLCEALFLVEEIDKIGTKIDERIAEELAWYEEKMATANPAMKAERLQ
jgi:hypothetical protein